MKHVTILMFLIFSVFSLHAGKSERCGFSVLSETGEKFTLTVNGIKQNKVPGTYVLVADLPADIVTVKINWANSQFKNFEKKLYLRMGEVEHYRIKVKNNGYYLAFDRSEPLPFQHRNYSDLMGGRQHAPSRYYYNDDYFGSPDCFRPVSNRSIYTMLQVIQNENFESDKLKRAKEAVTRSCLDSRQISLLVSSFSYEATKLEFAKFAYPYAYDKGAYMIVAEAFGYRSSKDALESFIASTSGR